MSNIITALRERLKAGGVNYCPNRDKNTLDLPAVTHLKKPKQQLKNESSRNVPSPLLSRHKISDHRSFHVWLTQRTWSRIGLNSSCGTEGLCLCVLVKEKPAEYLSLLGKRVNIRMDSTDLFSGPRGAHFPRCVFLPFRKPLIKAPSFTT